MAKPGDRLTYCEIVLLEAATVHQPLSFRILKCMTCEKEGWGRVCHNEASNKLFVVVVIDACSRRLSHQPRGRS
jgi:hypothetical protein